MFQQFQTLKALVEYFVSLLEENGCKVYIANGKERYVIFAIEASLFSRAFIIQKTDEERILTHILDEYNSFKPGTYPFKQYIQDYFELAFQLKM